MKRILVIEDDQNILDIVTFNLKREGYEVVTASDGEDALLTFAEQTFDLVLLDLMIPKLSGLEVLDSLRARSDVPVLIMSAKTSEEDRLDGLSRMADDYICKPFSVKELIARVKVHLARYSSRMTPPGQIVWGALELNENAKTVTKSAHPISVSKKEFQLILLFAKNQGHFYTRNELMKALWGYTQVQPEDRTVDVAVRRLREKIEDDPAHPKYIISKRGVGYAAGSGK